MRKKILFLCKSFFSYNDAIVHQLRKDGYEVIDCCYEKKKINWIERKIYSYKKIDYALNAFDEYIDQHVCKIDAANEIDVVLTAFLLVDANNMRKLKTTFKNAKFVSCIMDDVTWYKEEQFDSIRKDYDELLSYYEEDAVKYGMRYNPNFYIEETIQRKEFDWSFIGTAPKERENILKKILVGAGEFNKYIYIYHGQLGLRDQILEKKHYLQNREEIGKFIYYRPLSYESMQDIFSKSRCILDIQHPWQKGLSMRPFHAIGMHNKLITCNEEIRRYDFYHPQNIWVMDCENPVFPNEEFMYSDVKELPKEIYEKYSIQSWCLRLEEVF